LRWLKKLAPFALFIKNLQNLPPLLPQKPHRDGEGKIWWESRTKRNKVGLKGKRLSKKRK
jgi:hypothetical protein